MTADDIYKKIYLGESITTAALEPAAYHALRMSLARRHRQNVLLDLTTDALISSYDKETKKASFHLGQQKRREYELDGSGQGQILEDN